LWKRRRARLITVGGLAKGRITFEHDVGLHACEVITGRLHLLPTRSRLSTTRSRSSRCSDLPVSLILVRLRFGSRRSGHDSASGAGCGLYMVS
jgi:hypothetical protein